MSSAKRKQGLEAPHSVGRSVCFPHHQSHVVSVAVSREGLFTIGVLHASHSMSNPKEEKKERQQQQQAISI
jgi:hypothetical protein